MAEYLAGRLTPRHKVHAVDPTDEWRGFTGEVRRSLCGVTFNIEHIHRYWHRYVADVQCLSCARRIAALDKP